MQVYRVRCRGRAVPKSWYYTAQPPAAFPEHTAKITQHTPIPANLSHSHIHTYTETITFTHSHRHTLMLMHKHTLMLLLIQTHICSTQSPSTPAEKSMCISSITALTDGPGSLLPSPSRLSFPFFVQIQDVKMFTLRCRHSDELIAVFDSRTEHGGEKTHT